MVKMILLLLFSVSAGAETLQEIPLADSVDVAVLQNSLKAAGFQVLIRPEKDGSHTLIMHEADAKDPTPYINAAMPQEDKDLLALVAQWEAGKISAENKDALLLLLVKKVLGAP